MANEQLAYNGERLAVRKDYWMPRGDTKQIVFDHDLGAAAAVKTARLQVKNSSDTVLVSLTKADHASQWDFSTSGQGIVTLAASDTATITEGTYDFGIELTDQNDYVYTPVLGTINLSDDVVDNTGSSPYPSWDTLDDLELDIEQMATCGNITWLTTALAGGEGTLDVQNGAIGSATNNIRVVLDDGTYEDDTIDSVTDNEWTLSGTISGAASVGNVVRIL